jgi:hypothetical protein
MKNLLFRAPIVFSPLLSSCTSALGIKATALLFVAPGSKQPLSARFIAMSRDGGAQGINPGPCAVPSGTVNLVQITRSAPPEPSQNLKRHRTNTQGDACMDTNLSSAQDHANC